MGKGKMFAKIVSGGNSQRFTILGMADGLFGTAFKVGGGFVTGVMHGLGTIQKPLKNVGVLGMVPHLMGRAVGKTAVTVAKPILHGGWTLVKNTPRGAMSAGRSARFAGRTARKMFMKKAAEGEAKSLFGYKVRSWVPNALAIGAIGIGVAQGMGEARYNLGVETAVNGIMDTQGVATVPGTVNPSYTPVYNRPKGINNHGADGSLVLAMHKQRNTGYL